MSDINIQLEKLKDTIVGENKTLSDKQSTLETQRQNIIGQLTEQSSEIDENPDKIVLENSISIRQKSEGPNELPPILKDTFLKDKIKSEDEDVIENVDTSHKISIYHGMYV